MLGQDLKQTCSVRYLGQALSQLRCIVNCNPELNDQCFNDASVLFSFVCTANTTILLELIHGKLDSLNSIHLILHPLPFFFLFLTTLSSLASTPLQPTLFFCHRGWWKLAEPQSFVAAGTKFIHQRVDCAFLVRHGFGSALCN